MKSFPVSVLLVVALCVTALSLGYIVFNATPGSPLTVVPTSQVAQVSTDGLVSYWKFDEGSGKSISSSVGGISDTMQNPIWIAGKVNSALSFDGSDYVNIGNVSLSSFTISAWIRPSSNNSNYGSIVMKQNTYGLESLGNTLYARIGDGNSWYAGNNATLTGSITPGTWQLVTQTYDATTKTHTLYINKNATTGKNVNPSVSTGAPFLVGIWDTSFAEPFLGGIDEVRVYNRALSASEVAQLVDGTSTPTPSDTTAPVISSVSASGIKETSVTIGWTTNEASDSQIEYGLTSSYGSNTGIDSSKVTSHSQTITTGLVGGTVYNYRVKSRDAAGNIATSGNFTFKTSAPADVTSPTVPTNLNAASVTKTSLTLSWSASTDSVGIAGYRVFRNNTLVGTVTATTYNDSGLTSGTSYTYSVDAFDAAGNRSAQASRIVATLKNTAPTVTLGTPSVSGTAPATVTLTATASDTDGTVTSVAFYNGTTLLGTDTSSPYSYSWTSVPAGSYSVTARATDTDGAVTTSSAATVTVSPAVVGPVLLRYWSLNQTSGTTASDSSGNNGSATIVGSPAWSAGVAGNALTLNGSNQYLNAGNMGSAKFTLSAWVNMSSTQNGYGSVIIKKNTFGLEVYNGKVFANIGNGTSWTSTISGSLASGTWKHVVQTYDGTTNSLYIDGKFITSGRGALTNVSSNLLIGSWDTSSEFFKGMIDEVRVYDGALTDTEVGNLFKAITPPVTPIDVNAPATPTGLTATAVSSSQINLSWTASTDNVGVTGYQVFRNGIQIANITPAATTFQNTSGLSPSTSYSYTIRAYDAAANMSGQSIAASATTQVGTIDTNAPTTPTGLTATAVSSSQINLSWTASTDNVGIAGYRIMRNGTQIALVTSGTTYQNTGLTASTAYSYTVSAYDAAGNSSAASEPPATATTQPVTPPATGSLYMTPSGAGTKDGSSWANAFAGTSGINWNTVTAGKTLYVGAGTYGTLTVGSIGSSKTNRVTIKAAQDANVGIAYFKGLNLINGHYVTIDGNYNGNRNFDITGTVNASSANHFELKYLNVHSADIGIAAVYGVGGLISYVNISDITTEAGIQLNARNYQVPGYDQTIIEHTKIVLNQMSNGSGTGPDGIQGCWGLTVQDSILTGQNGTITGAQHQDLIQMMANYVTIRRNSFIASADSSIDYDTFNGQPAHHQIYDNTFIMTRGGGIRYYGGGGITFKSMTDVHIFNNTFVDHTSNHQWAISIDNIVGGNMTTSDVAIKNNLFLNSLTASIFINSANGVDQSSYGVDYNLTSGTGGIVVDGTNYTQPHQPTGTPLFAGYVKGSSSSDLRLSVSDTAARDKGVDLSAYFSTDKDGNARPQGTAWDIGAYEYVGTTPPASTYTLTTGTAGTGGTITRSPNATTYTAGTVVTLTATPTTAGHTVSWSGCTSTTATCTVTMNANTTVTATFAAPVTPTGSILTKLVGSDFSTGTAPAGVVSKLDGGATTATNPLTTASLTVGTHTVAVTDVANQTESYGICTYAVGGTECSMPTSASYGTTGMTCAAGFCSVSAPVTASMVTKVVFKYDAIVASTYTLTTGTAGTGGTITRSPNATTYTAGTVVTLTATPTTAGHTVSWSGCTSTTATCTVTMNANTTVTATFTLPVVTDTTFYVRPGGTGNGSDWTNALGVLPSNPARGTTYYVAGGSYPAYKFSTPVSGTTLVTIKKATAADHGTNAGWVSTYGTTQAVFNASETGISGVSGLSGINFATGYVVFDGQTRTDMKSGHGFKVVGPAPGGAGIRIGNGATIGANGVTIKNTAITGHGQNAPGNQSDGPSGDNGVWLDGTSSGLTLANNYVYSWGGTMIKTYSGSIESSLFDNNWFEWNSSSAAHHAEGVFAWGMNNTVFKNNVWVDIEGTGIVLMGNGGNNDFYGNLVYWTSSYPRIGQNDGYISNGIFTSWSAYTTTNNEFYNNTVILPSRSGGYEFGMGYINNTTSSGTARNNLYYAPTTGRTIGSNGVNSDYDMFYNVGHESQTNGINGTGNPFVNSATYNFSLNVATPAGVSLGSPYNVDITGRTRTNWSRGAYEYTGAANSSPTVTLSTPIVSGNAPATVTLTAAASDSDGTVSSVAFYNESTLLGTDNSSPYSYSWTGVAAGSYTAVTARATDNGGAITTSSAVSVTVNSAPSAKFTAGQSIKVSGTKPGYLNLRATPSMTGLINPLSNTLVDDVVGVVVSHASNGIYAEGYYWWYVTLNGSTGWAAEYYLVANTIDTTAPTVPTGLMFSNITQTALTLTWDQSTDANMAGYKVYRGGVQIATTTVTTITNTGLAASTAYSYTVRAYDTTGNISAHSTAASATTLAITQPSGNTFYVRPSASGNGSDWNNALGALPATLVRGATYYVGSGSYGSQTFNTSGTSGVATVLKALDNTTCSRLGLTTAQCHGTDTGWTDSHGTGTATFTKWGIIGSNLIIDGQKGAGSLNLGDTDYGFKVSKTSGAVICIGSNCTGNQSTLSNITIKHTEVEGGGDDGAICTGSDRQNKGIFMYWGTYSNITLANNYFHDFGNMPLHLSGMVNSTVEYNYIARNESITGACEEHAEGLFGDGSSNSVIRYNVWEDIEGSGVIMLSGSGWKVYGNLIFRTGNAKYSNTSNGSIASWSSLPFSNSFVYNNTIANCLGVCGINPGGSGNSVANNIVMDTASYTSSRFVNAAQKNFRLAAPYTTGSVTLSAPYDKDMDGKTRGSNGWDLGAFEY